MAPVNGQRTLLLMRHAKSDYPAGVIDHDRPLARRGIREAGLAGGWLRAHMPPIDGVLCGWDEVEFGRAKLVDFEVPR